MEPWKELGFDSLEAFRQEIGGHLQDIVSSEGSKRSRLTDEEWQLYRVAKKSLLLLRLMSNDAPDRIVASHVESLRKACEEYQAGRS